MQLSVLRHKTDTRSFQGVSSTSPFLQHTDLLIQFVPAPAAIIV